MLVNCMLDSGAMHSFVHPRIVQTTEAQPSEGAVLTVTVANDSKLLCNDVCLLELTFTAERGERQVTVLSQLYVLDGLQSDVILGVDFLKWYSPSISWIDCRVGMPCLALNGGVCQSSANDVAEAVPCSDCRGMSKCNNGVLCKK